MKKRNFLSLGLYFKAALSVGIIGTFVLLSSRAVEIPEGASKEFYLSLTAMNYVSIPLQLDLSFTGSGTANLSTYYVTLNGLYPTLVTVYGLTESSSDDDILINVKRNDGKVVGGGSVTVKSTSSITSTTMEPDCGPTSSGSGACFNESAGTCALPSNAGGDSTARNASADFTVYLGTVQGLNGGVGYLQVHVDAPSFYMYTPKMLEAHLIDAPDAELIRDEKGWVRQVRVPAGLFDVVTNNQYSYNINFFTPGNFSDKDSSGYYTSGTVARTFFVGSPEVSPRVCDKLNFSNIINGAVVKSYQFIALTNDVGDVTWDLVNGGVRRDKVNKLWTVGGSSYTKFIEISDSAGHVSEKCQEDYRMFSGQNDKLMNSRYDDGAGLFLSASYQYYDNPADIKRFGKLAIWASDIIESKAGLGCNSGGCKGCASSTGRTGGWGAYLYNDDGYSTNEISAWLDSPLSSPASLTRNVVRSYDPISRSGDDSTLNKWRARTESTYVTNVLVGRKYYCCYLDGSPENNKVEFEEVAASPSAAFGSVSNLQTVTAYYSSNTFAFVSPEIKFVQRSDGTLDSYTIEFGSYSYNATDPATSSFAVGDGSFMRRTITHGTIFSPAGVMWKTTQERHILDESSREVLSETYVYNGTDYERISWQTTLYDASGHPVNTYSSDIILPVDSTWGDNCCGKVSEKDGYGAETLFNYDPIGRLIGKVRKGVSSPADDLIYEYGLDSAGRTTYEVRRNADNSLRSVISSNQYDIAGRLTNSVNEAGLVTSYFYSNAGRTKKVVSPGSVTNVTELYLDGKVKSVTENCVTQQFNLYGANADGTQWRQTFTGPSGINSPVWQKTTTDFLGHTLREEKPGYSSSPTVQCIVTNSFFYNAKGQLIRTQVSGVTPQPYATLYEYDEIGNQSRSGIDVNNNGTLDLNGLDRITDSNSFYQKDAGNNFFRVNSTIVHAQNNNQAGTVASVQKTRLTGLGIIDPTFGVNISETTSIDILNNQTVSRTYVNRDAKQVTQVVTVPDSTTNAVSVSVNGKLLYTISKTGTRTDFTYDVFGRQTAALQGGPGGPRTVGNYTHYNAKGQVDYTDDTAGKRTSYVYDSATGRRISVTNPLNEVTCYQYDTKGQLLATWGNVYPVMYDYDNFNRMTAMYTLRDTSVVLSDSSAFDIHKSAFDKTTWLYDQATGLLTNKLYADNKGPVYTYTPDGKLLTRTWARGASTTYRYDPIGQLTNIIYSGLVPATPSVVFAYDRMGHQTNIVDGLGSRKFVYNNMLQLASETNMFGTITRKFDTQGHVSGLALSAGGAEASLLVDYGFDEIGRFNSVSSSVLSASVPLSRCTYAYLPGADLISGYAISSGVSSVTLTVSRTYETNRNLIAQLKNMVGLNNISQFDYCNDALGRRTNRTDKLSGISLLATNTFSYNPRSELMGAIMSKTSTNLFSYDYDPIGNRLKSVKPYPSVVTNTYVVNAMNQYTSVVSGLSPSALKFDLDGNLTNDGVNAYAWDVENRLVSVTPIAPISGSKRVKMSYDYMSRRYTKTVDNWSGSAWVGQSTNKFTYDGWNLISESAQTPGLTVTNSYVWGLDLSGSLQGAGGIGGLMASSLGGATATTTVFYAADANGNVTDLINTNGTLAAHYEYDPYGNTLSATGTQALTNKFRFSTKYTDDETGLLYYGYRYYDAGTGRWLGRDPIGEQGGENLYRFIQNSPITEYDYMGLMSGWFGSSGGIGSLWSDTYFGLTTHTLLENKCACSCNKDSKYSLSCTLTLMSQISLSAEGAPIWDTPPYSYPGDPSPSNWATMSYSQKRENVLQHELRHYNAYKNWWTSRKYRIEGFEMLVYPSLNECNQRGTILTTENDTGYAKVEKEQSDYDAQGHY